jgi:hypothetical protein
MQARLLEAGEGSWCEDGKRYRQDESMRALVGRSELISKTIWPAEFWALGFATWRARNRVLAGILEGTDVSGDVFGGRPEHLDRLLGLYSPSRFNGRFSVSLGGMSMTGRVWVDLKRRVHGAWSGHG